LSTHDEHAGERRRRIFFALWPDEPTRAALVRATRRAVRLSGGRPTARHNLHVTVAFLGGITEEALERAASVPPVEVGSFALTLDTLGFQPRSRVLWLAAREIPRQLTALEQRLWEGLVAEGFERERRAYRPHVTLTRRGRAIEDPVRPLTWPARKLALCESVQTKHGGRYQPLRFWPL
jgi:RNA 2',3'-cyclic 3'-phosphodiesterase